MYGVKVITTDFVANIKRFAENRTEETTKLFYRFNCHQCLYTSERNNRILFHRFNSNHILQAVFHLLYTSKHYHN